MIQEKDIKVLVEKYYKGEITQQELESVLDLFENPFQNLALRPILFEIWSNEQRLNSVYGEITEDFKQILDQVHHQINLNQNVKPSENRSRLVRNIISMAAVLLLGLILGFFVRSLKPIETIFFTSIAPKGSISQIVLPDSTLVFLNSGSTLKYSVGKKNGTREVFLDGEAWFDVAKNVQRPFFVHTAFYDVKVLGTQFNVKAYGLDYESVTTLEKGTVEINFSNESNLNKTKYLKVGEQIVYDQENNKTDIKHVNTRIYTSWKDNKLIFINMSLKELIILLERKYGIDIEVADNSVLDYHYDGTLKNETILEVLDLLKETLPVQYKIDGQKVIILKQ